MNKKEGARSKLRRHFLDNVGRVMGTDELRKVAGNITEWARRVRELRNEEGYRILTHRDRSDLKPGEYLLVDPKPIPALSRQISKELRARVLERNGFTCHMCGAVAGESHPYDPSRKTRLHVDHILPISHGGRDEMTNLRAICSVCNEGIQNIAPIRSSLRELIVQVRRAKRDDQIEVLKWLIAKYREELKDLDLG